MNVTRSRELRVLLQEQVERREPAQHVLAQVGAVHAQDQEVPPAAQQLLLELPHPLALGDQPGRLVVDRQRIGPHPHLPVSEPHQSALEVHLQVHQVAAALQEVVPVGARVETDDVVRQQPRVDLFADPRRQHTPRVGLRPRDVDEVVQEHVRTCAAHQVREGVQVVVVDHHDRLLGALELLDDGAREILVDDVVAELERLDLLAADVRRVGQVPQVVLDEPQHRVGEHVVEAVVGVRVADHQPHLILAAGGGAHREGAPGVLARDLHVVLAHRRGDPDRFAVGGEARQRRHQSAGAALHLSAGGKRDRPAVAHQHQRSTLCRLAAHASLSSLNIRR